MTNNIAKLYELAGFEKAMGVGSPVALYPFTPEKQLELIKWLCKNTYRNYFKIIFDFQNKTWYMECDCYPTPNKRNFEESLAFLTISIWNDLTDKQKEEIKEILE